MITSIRETIAYVLNTDIALGDRIRVLFREQGITITSLLTALGFVVSTIVLAIKSALSAAAEVIPNRLLHHYHHIFRRRHRLDRHLHTRRFGRRPSKPPGVKDWIVEQLKKLDKWLLDLAGKAAAYLPQIIDSVVSFENVG